jgi:hypothetical protein
MVIHLVILTNKIKYYWIILIKIRKNFTTLVKYFDFFNVILSL